MSIEITVPVLGESVTEGVLTRWLKAVGDRVDVDEPLFEISTDKVDTEVPSPVSGVLRQLLAEEDDTVEVAAQPSRCSMRQSRRDRPPKVSLRHP